jgi:hypothetical protein
MKSKKTAIKMMAIAKKLTFFKNKRIELKLEVNKLLLASAK